MQGKYKVITLCGSTRFKDEFLRVQKELTLKGYIVISVGLFGHSGDNEVLADGVKEMLDDMHLAKIDMADEIFLVTPIGCGIAGWRVAEIAPLFKEASRLENVTLPKSFWTVLDS